MFGSKPDFFFLHFYAARQISLALLASGEQCTRRCCILCNVERTVTHGTPQRVYQNNKHHPNWLRAALPSRWSGGVAVSRPLSSPRTPTATPAPVTLAAARRTEAYLMRRFLPCLPLGSRLSIARHCVLKIFCSTEHFWPQDAYYCQPITLVSSCKIVYLASIIM